MAIGFFLVEEALLKPLRAGIFTEGNVINESPPTQPIPEGSYAEQIPLQSGLEQCISTEFVRKCPKVKVALV